MLIAIVVQLADPNSIQFDSCLYSLKSVRSYTHKLCGDEYLLIFALQNTSVGAKKHLRTQTALAPGPAAAACDTRRRPHTRPINQVVGFQGHSCHKFSLQPPTWLVMDLHRVVQ
jgi:hypothetical protein